MRTRSGVRLIGGPPRRIAVWLARGWRLGAAIAALAGCATLAPREPQDGLGAMASWYGRAHQARPTASGEPFDMHDLTAAHRTLPLGTRVRVTDLENGRTVVVRITDRGPYVPGRLIDLSYAAAKVLGMLDRGVVPVRLEVLSSPPSGSVPVLDADRRPETSGRDRR